MSRTNATCPSCQTSLKVRARGRGRGDEARRGTNWERDKERWKILKERETERGEGAKWATGNDAICLEGAA